MQALDDGRAKKSSKARRADPIPEIIYPLLREFVEAALVTSTNVTRETFQAILADWPATRGPRALGLDAGLVRRAHAALLKDHPTWGQRAATDELARLLHVDARTIRRYLGRQN